MNEYYPDRWMLVKVVDSIGEHYRVFGSWYGGYLGSDSWRMNSGIEKVEYDGETYRFYGSSGSVYHCHKNVYGVHMYGASVIEGMKKTIDIVPLYDMPNIDEIKF